ncbi:hypothetical protein F5148DRAFT_1201135 [Russula earlei]|uniref:Uncharacterized protein n=1 Tax=Russula earlei TaxID=71964 RepID=A0ACC0U9W6_9AGAM|nr:hypothetical protein F5148DRAFT_1201135 [Russula earlei]
MVVIDEKTMLPPPPAYSLPRTNPNIPTPLPVPESLHPPPFSAPYRTLATLSDLPSHLLLHVVHRTFPQAPDKSYNKVERQRKTLRWLTASLRLVNRTFYIACMHVLRSTFLPSYTSLIRPPYTSDPFPLQTPPGSVGTALNRSRETVVLDLFIALKVHDDVFADESELHLGQPEAFRDLFDLMQPRARLDDLLRAYLAPTRVNLSAYSVTFAPRRVGVIGPSRRTIVDVERAKDERLEVAAKRLARKLQEYLAARC